MLPMKQTALLFCRLVVAAAFCMPTSAHLGYAPIPSSTREAGSDSGIQAFEDPRLHGFGIMRDPLVNKGLGFNRQQREQLGLEGLLPYAVLDLDLQALRAIGEVRAKSNNLEKYIFMQTLQDTNERLYYALLTRYTAELLPIVYTPVVGEACEQFHKIYRQTPRGIYLNLHHRGRIKQVLSNWPRKDIKAIVCTDGERILGLGDLGVNGMGIPIGKLALYTAFGGVPPEHCLPVHLDVGTNNEMLRNSPFYMGIRQKRATGAEYDEFIEEFITASNELYGRSVMMQFEDFGNHNAFRLWKDYQNKCCSFNDDIQGTAAVVLAGLIAAAPLTGKSLRDHMFLFLGAGEAGVGIADLITHALHREAGLTIEEARSKIWLFDSKGLVVQSRAADLQEHKKPYARDHKQVSDFLTAVKELKPTAIIGVAAQPNAFNEQVCRAMVEHTERPLIFALSNPTSKAECTAEQAFRWTDGKCVFASGSPFGAVTLGERTFTPGQANNAYMFPGIGLGAVACGATKLDNEDMYRAAKTLASQVDGSQLQKGCIYPALSNIRDVSARIAASICETAYERGTATVFPKPQDVYEHCKAVMYNPN